jgi:hypothetical protein
MEPQQNRDLKPEYLSLNIGEINALYLLLLAISPQQ